MANVTIRLEVDPVSRRRTIVVSYQSDADALPNEHEEEHRALVQKLIEGGLIAAEEAGAVRVERASGTEASVSNDAAPEAAKRQVEQKG